MSNRKAKIASSVQKEDQVKNRGKRGLTEDNPQQNKAVVGGRRCKGAKTKKGEENTEESRDSVSSVSRQTRDDSQRSAPLLVATTTA